MRRLSAQIMEALSRSKSVGFVGSTCSLRSHNVSKELSLASEPKKTILPLPIDDNEIPPDFLYQLAALQVARLREPSHAAETVRTIVSVLDAVKPSAE